MEMRRKPARPTRLRLAREYLAEARAEASEDDDEGVARRLRPDTSSQPISGRVRWDSERFVSLKAHRGPVTCACLGENHAVTGSKDNGVAVFDLSTGTLTRRLVERWPRRAPRFVEEARGVDSTSELAPRQASEAEVWAVASRGSLVAAGGRDRLVHVWDMRAPDEAFSLRGHSGSITGLSFGDDNLYSAAEDGTLKVWRHAAHLETVFGHEGPVRSLDVLDDRPVSGGSDATLRSWKIRDETHLVYRAAPGTSVDACWRIDAHHFASGSDDGAVSLWSSTRKKPSAVVRTAHGRDGLAPRWITAVGGFRHTDLVASGASDGTVRFYSLPSLDPVATTLSVPGVVAALSSTPDYRLLAVAASHEPKFGRWFRVNRAPNALLLFPSVLDEA
ncbi:hypothetical protein CTAYLR_001597 [Chrysophaeum taylorii]|uniref:Uncharacterized protein n=1 Tax=Chrysophaeum taylorii TaxID=2483200 RepID=A0AAD7UD30_9STRA|nr:hypothetical protein CTAYLR_001597 [Chrysophaeum taylorii]